MIGAGIQLDDKVYYYSFRKVYSSKNSPSALQAILNKITIISNFMNNVTETHSWALPADGSHLILVNIRDSIRYHSHRFLR